VRRLVAVGLVALTASAAAADAAPGVGVTLKAGTSSASLNASVSLRAVAHGLARGDRVRIVGRRGGGVRASTVVTCAKAVCTGRFADQFDESVTFQALVVRHGRTIAHSASVAVAWKDTSPPPAPAPPTPPPPPPPAPAPSAPAGHYCGLTDEGKSICFDVSAAPQAVMSDMRTESIANCGDGSSWVWTLSFSSPVSILQPGLTASYQYTGSLPDFSDATHVQVSYDVHATFDTAGNATGTLTLNHVSWDQSGTHYDCSGVARPWHARLGA
jgi:hypothetical protein